MTKGQVEDAITKKVVKFYFNTIGVGPEKAKTYIVEDMIIVRFKGHLLPIEQKLLYGNNGIELVKNIRQSIHELTIKESAHIISEITRQTVVSTHSDISTKSGEIIQIFILENNYQKTLDSKID
jgi:uncharacterized protein YbcI